MECLGCRDKANRCLQSPGSRRFDYEPHCHGLFVGYVAALVGELLLDANFADFAAGLYGDMMTCRRSMGAVF